MLIQDNMQPDTAGIADDLIHELYALESLQVRVLAVVDAARLAPRVKKLVGVGKTDGIITLAYDLVQHILVISVLQTMHYKRIRFKTKPIYSRYSYRLVVCI